MGEPAKCATACTSTSCGSGTYCSDTGACQPTRSAGESCSADAECTTGVCGGVCCEGPTFSKACGGGCTHWSFESSVEGWKPDTNPAFPVNGGGATNGVTNVTVSTNIFHDGAHSLAVPGLANGQVVSVAVPICKLGNTLNLAGFTMSAWVYITGTDLSIYSFLFFDAWGPSGSISAPVLTGSKIVDLGSWHEVTATFSSSVDADHVAVRLNPEMNWNGTLYVDTVTVTGP